MDDTPHIKLSVAAVELPNGVEFEQYVLRMRRCAMTVVLDDAAENVLLMWRHRFIIDRWVWELPGGYADDGEDGPVTAAREVEEETGRRPRSIEHVLTFQPMIGNGDFPQDARRRPVHHGTAPAGHPRATRSAPRVLEQLISHSAASRGMAVALETLMNTGSPVFARARMDMVEAIASLMTAAAQAGTIRAEITPETVFQAMGGICTSHDQPGWEPDAHAVVRLLLDGLRYGVR